MHDRYITELWSHDQWRCDLVAGTTLRLYEGHHRVVELAVDDEPMARTCAELWRAAAASLTDVVPPLSGRLRPAPTDSSIP